MKKILIVGQAPPAKEQKVPYDSTLLYEILSWVGITKEQAQKMFEFEAVSNVFPGTNEKGGHLKPSKIDIDNHWSTLLCHKMNYADKIIILGKVAETEIKRRYYFYGRQKFLYMLHPSRRNHYKIMKRKIEITDELKVFLCK